MGPIDFPETHYPQTEHKLSEDQRPPAKFLKRNVSICLQNTRHYMWEDCNINSHSLMKLESQLAVYLKQADSHAALEPIGTHINALRPGASLTVRQTTRNTFLPVSIPGPILSFFFLPAFTSFLSTLLSFFLSFLMPILSPFFRSVILRLTYRHWI